MELLEIEIVWECFWGGDRWTGFDSSASSRLDDLGVSLLTAAGDRSVPSRASGSFEQSRSNKAHVCIAHPIPRGGLFAFFSFSCLGRRTNKYE